MEAMSSTGQQHDNAFRLPSLTSLIPEESAQMNQHNLNAGRADPRWSNNASQPILAYDPAERGPTQPPYDYAPYHSVASQHSHIQNHNNAPQSAASATSAAGFLGGPASHGHDQRGSLSSASYVESSRHSSQSTARSSLSSAAADPHHYSLHNSHPAATWPEPMTHQTFSYGPNSYAAAGPAQQLSPGSRAAALGQYKPEFSPPFPVQHGLAAGMPQLGHQAMQSRAPLPAIRYSPVSSYASLRRDSLASSVQDDMDGRRASYPHIMSANHSPGGSGLATASGSSSGHGLADARRGSHPSLPFAPYPLTRPSTVSSSAAAAAAAGSSTNTVAESPDAAGKPKKRRGNLSRKATNMLKAWLNEHVDHPYPSEDEKLALSAQTELTIAQISNWFINARRRILAPRFASKNQSSVWNEIKMNHHIHGASSSAAAPGTSSAPNAASSGKQGDGMQPQSVSSEDGSRSGASPDQQQQQLDPSSAMQPPA